MINRQGPEFVGRGQELALLTAALDANLSRQGQMVMLAGEPGIEKTRTAQELARMAEEAGGQVLWGWCYEGEGAPPYWPWIDSLRTYFQRTDPAILQSQLGTGATSIGDMVPEVLGIIGDFEPVPAMEPDQARFRLFDAITRFLKRASEDSPLLVVLDDLHWADRPSLLLLEFIARQLEGSRILIVGTYRDTEAPPESPLGESLARFTRLPGFQRQAITGLPPEDVGRFVHVETGATPHEQLLSAIHGHTEGNPYFLGEVVRYLAEQGRLTGDAIDSNTPGSVAGLSIPQGVRDVIGQRLIRLTRPCNQALVTASVIGREFEFNLLTSLLDSASEADLLDLMDEAISARIIDELPGSDARYQFRHALMQQTLTESISAGRKTRLHARIGEALEAKHGNDPGDHTTELAHHFTQAASILGNDRMVHYTLLAGERALATHAWEKASGHFARGLEAKDLDPDGRSPATDADAAGLLFGLSRARSADLRFGPGYIQQIVGNLRSAFEYHLAAGDNERAVEIAQSPPRVPVGDRGGLVDVAKAALGIAAPGTVAKGRLLANYAWFAAMEENDYPAAESSFQEALEIARGSNDVLLLQQILAQAAQVDFYHRRFEEAIDKAKQVLSIPALDLDMFTECAARYVYCISAISIGAPASTEELEAFHSVAERLGDRLWLHLSYWLPQRTAGLYGDWEKAREFGVKGLAVAPGAPTLLSTLPQIELETGEFDRAEELFQILSGSLPENPASPIWRYAATVAVSGISSFAIGKPREPELPASLIEVSSSSPYAIPLLVSVSDTGRALEALAQGDEETCRSAYAALASSNGRIFLVVAGDRILGQLAAATGNIPQAMEHFEDSLAFCHKAGYRPEYAWTCWAYSAALLAHGDSGGRRKAAELLKEALDIVNDLGMPPLLARVEDLMARSGGGTAPANPAGLTQREVEVIRLVSSGMTDREIGEELFISIKTVGNHLSNILNKTNAANRTEAASFANQHGLITPDSEDEE